MAVKYDAESLLDTVLEIMTNGGALNAKIDAIEAEKISISKGLTPTLAQVAATSYHLQTWTEKVLQSSPAIFYGIEDVKAESNGSAVAKTYSIFVEVVMTDSGLSNDGSKRINRYARALEELFAESFKPAIASSMVKIDQVRPVAWKVALDSDDEIKVGGISLTISLV